MPRWTESAVPSVHSIYELEAQFSLASVESVSQFPMCNMGIVPCPNLIGDHEHRSW